MHVHKYACVYLLTCIHAIFTHTHTCNITFFPKRMMVKKCQGWAQNITKKHKRNKVADFKKSGKYF